MFQKIKIQNHEYNCYYETFGDSKNQPLVLLHGWGVDSNIFKNIIEPLEYYIITLDFIGFGKSDTPLNPFTVDDYVTQVHELLKNLKIKNCILLGHSFGGRVAIKYNYYYNIDKLILVDSAGIRKKNKKTRKKIIKYKLKKLIYSIFNKKKYQELINNSGSRDYKNLTPIMKQTMNKVLKEDLKKYCLKRRTPTVILWGINDRETPLEDGYTFHKLFNISRMVIFYKSGHFPHLDESPKFIRVLNEVKNDWYIIDNNSIIILYNK